MFEYSKEVKMSNFLEHISQITREENSSRFFTVLLKPSEFVLDMEDRGREPCIGQTKQEISLIDFLSIISDPAV